jgi:L-amino acid N-acyltransferase YncA
VSIKIGTFQPSDWKAVRRIYTQGIAMGLATFETTAPEWSDWDSTHLPAPRLVAVSRGWVVGWAALSPVSARPAYRGVAEVSVYVAEDQRGQGVGSALLRRLIEESEAAGIWMLQAAVFPENVDSVRLHVQAGFREVGTRERLGQLNGEWRDVLLLERRSARVGTAPEPHSPERPGE